MTNGSSPQNAGLSESQDGSVTDPKKSASSPSSTLNADSPGSATDSAGDTEQVSGASSVAQPEPFSTDEVNQQILGAVQASTDFAFGLTANLVPPVPDGTRLSAGAAIAFEKAAQAASLSLQDASDYARNVMSVAGVAQGKALAEILAGVNVSNAQTAMTQAQTAVTAAVSAVGNLAKAQTDMLKAFPRA